MIMGKLLDIVKTKLAAIRQELAAPIPDPAVDPAGAIAAIKRKNALRYLQTYVGKDLLGALRQLPVEKQDEFYDSCIQENAKTRFTRENFHSSVNNPNDEGTFLINDQSFGQNWEQTVERLEELLDEETIERTAVAVEYRGSPDDLPEEFKLRYPYQNKIKELEDKYADQSDNPEETRQFLEQLNEQMAAPDAEMSHYIDRLDHDIQRAVDKAMYQSIHRYMEKEPGKKFAGKMPQTQYSTVDYEIPVAETTSGKHPLLPEDVEEMKTIHPVISDVTKNELIEITGMMNQLDDEYLLDNITSPLPGTGKRIFTSEQSTKYYAFWPLVMKKVELGKAIDNGKISEIRQNASEYAQTKGIMDQMMNIVKKNPSPTCGGNINSTRTAGDQISPIPLDYQEDFISHCKLNGVFLLYGLSKNTGKTVKELLEDPVKSMTDASENYIRTQGLNSKKSVAEKLVYGLNPAIAETFKRNWNSGFSMLANRAFNGAASMARTEEERDQLHGVGQLAVGAASRPVNMQAELWDSLNDISPEQQRVLYQHALLLDDDAFDPLAMAENLQKKSWKKDLNPADLIEHLKAEGKLDIPRLIKRIDEIKQQADKVEEDLAAQEVVSVSKFKNREFDQAAFLLGKEILRRATPDELKTDAYVDLQNTVDRYVVAHEAESIDQLEKQLEENLHVQAKPKKGFFLSSKNSTEHQQMTMSQKLLCWKLKMLRGEDLPDVPDKEKAVVKQTPLAILVNNARHLTFEYCSAKSNKGEKTTFSYDTGTERYDAARESLTTLDDLIGIAGTKTPAHRTLDRLRLDILDHRHDEDWVEEHAADYAGRCMYAMSVDFKHPDASKQERSDYMNENKIRRQSAAFQKKPSFQKMLEKHGEDKLLEFLVEGKGTFTQNFVKAKAEIAKQKHKDPGKDYKDMTQQERGDVWAQMGPF